MDSLKKIGHWIVFIIVCPIITWTVLFLIVMAPLWVFQWIFDWNIILFVLASYLFFFFLYMPIIFGGLDNYYAFLNRYKPDKWLSSIFISVLAIIFIYRFYPVFDEHIGSRSFKDFGLKGYLYIMVTLGLYLRVAITSSIASFLPEIGIRERI